MTKKIYKDLVIYFARYDYGKLIKMLSLHYHIIMNLFKRLKSMTRKSLKDWRIWQEKYLIVDNCARQDQNDNRYRKIWWY